MILDGWITSNTIPDYTYCGHKLPCGICRLTMCACPKDPGYKVTPTWTSTGTGTDIRCEERRR